MGRRVKWNMIRGLRAGGPVQKILKYAESKGYTLPDQATIDKISNRIKYLKAEGLWDELDRLYYFDLDDANLEDFSTIDWIDPSDDTRALINGSPVYGGNGFTFSNNNYLNTQFVPSQGGKFQSENASMGCRVFNGTGSNNNLIFGARNSSSRKCHISRTQQFFHGAVDLGSTDSVDGNDFFLMCKNSGVGTGYFNGVAQVSQNYSDVALVTHAVYIGCMNSSGTPFSFYNAGVRMFFAGSGVIEAKQDIFRDILLDLYVP
jgi:hypothetical protein